MEPNNKLIDFCDLNRVIDVSPLTVTPDTLVVDAIPLMIGEGHNYSNKFGVRGKLSQPNKTDRNPKDYVLVVEGLSLVGIFTHIDIVRLAGSGINFSGLRISEVMTQQVISLKISPNHDIFTLRSLMHRHGIHHLPILDWEEKLVGIITHNNLQQVFAVEEKIDLIPGLQKQLKSQENHLKEVQEELYQTRSELKQQVNRFEKAKICCKREIKVRSQIEAQINFQANVLAHVSDAVIAIDNEHHVVYLNRRAEQLYDIEADEFIGRHLEEIYKYQWIDDEDKYLADNALSTQGWWQGENIHIKNNGQEIHVDLSISFLQDNSGNKIGLLAVIRDITKRKQVEKQLRRTEALLQEAQRVAKMGSWSWDLNTGEKWWSEEFYRFTNLNQDSPIPNIEVANQFIHSADRARVNKITKAALEQGIPYETEFRFLRPDSTVGYAFSCGRVDKDAQGRVVRFYGISQDISEYKQVEEALRESKERYRDLAQKLHSLTVNAPIYIYELDRNGRIIFANRTNECVSQEKLLGSLVTKWFPPDQRSSIDSVLEQVFTTQQVQEIEYAIPDRKGDTRFYKTQIAPNQVQGKATTAVLIASDITERKLAEEKIVEQAALLDVTTDAILLRSLSGEIIYYNQAAESMYGWTSQEAIGQVANELLYKEISPELTEALTTTKDKHSWQGELHKITKEGKEIIVASRWTLVKDKLGNPKSILTVDTDITEKKQLEKQFLRAQRLESLGTLASGIAHDLNNILTPILAVSQLLPFKVTNLDRSSQDMLKMLESSAKRGANLVKQILSFARGNEARRTVLQVKHLLRDVEQFVKGTFPKFIEIERNLPRDLWTVAADPTQLHQVFMNLVVNARDAMPDGGTLSILAENIFVDESYARMNIDAKVGPYVVVTIADTGIGIPPENIDRIFDPFFTTKEVGKGTGLGLSTVLGIIKNHDGFVKISSELGKGSQFQIYLPSQEGLVSEKKQDLQGLVGKGEVILVIDDEAKICEIIKTTLENYNLQVLTAKDGIEGISVYANHKDDISIVLTDMMMPIMDGATTIRTLQRINPRVKIIATSGLASTETLAKASGTGVQGFLAKPFTAYELVKAIAEVLPECGEQSLVKNFQDKKF